MEDVSLDHAKQHLEELIERARRGEDVRISDPKLGTVRLAPLRGFDVTAPRITDTMEPFVPLAPIEGLTLVTADTKVQGLGAPWLW